MPAFWSLSRKTKGNDKKEAQQVVGINKKHDWFFEIQAMLHITEREFCVFSVWSGHDENSKCIKYKYPDELFWSSQMENKILEFYNNHLLPEIIDPRKRRGMPIRGVKVKEVSGKKAVDSGENCDENGQGYESESVNISEIVIFLFLVGRLCRLVSTKKMHL